MRLFGEMCCSIIVGHAPGNVQEPEKEGPALAAPTRIVCEVCEDERGASLVWRADQESDADADGCQNVDRREPEDDLV